MPRNTKADRILLDAEMRLEAARIRQRTAQSELNTTTATLDALQDAYDALKKELAPQPRKKNTKPATAEKEPTKSDPIPEGLCSYKYPDGSVCLAAAGNAIHDKSMGYAGYHPFEAPAPIATQRSTRRSRSTKASESSTPNSETEKENVSAVAAGN